MTGKSMEDRIAARLKLVGNVSIIWTGLSSNSFWL
jgi:hypothetical protein